VETRNRGPFACVPWPCLLRHCARERRRHVPIAVPLVIPPPVSAATCGDNLRWGHEHPRVFFGRPQLGTSAADGPSTEAARVGLSLGGGGTVPKYGGRSGLPTTDQPPPLFFFSVSISSETPICGCVSACADGRPRAGGVPQPVRFSCRWRALRRPSSLNHLARLETACDRPHHR